MISNIRKVLNKIIMVCCIALLTAPMLRAEDSVDLDPGVLESHWSIEFKAGRFTPTLERWEEFYYGDSALQVSGSLAYKFFRNMEIGAELGYSKAEGRGQIISANTLVGEVTQQLFPLHLFLLYRAKFYEDQLVVPYIGGGYSKIYYRQSIEAQGSSRGDTDGTHLRYGLQILLDRADPGNSAAMEEHSVTNTYITIEAQDLTADIDGFELGGKSLNIGLMFEF